MLRTQFKENCPFFLRIIRSGNKRNTCIYKNKKGGRCICHVCWAEERVKQPTTTNVREEVGYLETSNLIRVCMYINLTTPLLCWLVVSQIYFFVLTILYAFLYVFIQDFNLILFVNHSFLVIAPILPYNLYKSTTDIFLLVLSTFYPLNRRGC